MSGSQVDPANTAIYEPIRQPVQSFPVLRIGFVLCFIARWRIFRRKRETFSLFSKPFPFTGYPRVFTFQDAGEQTPKGRKKGHGNSVKAVCHVLSMVLVLTSKAGGCRLLSGFYTGINPACPAVELYAKRVNKNMKLLSQSD